MKLRENCAKSAKIIEDFVSGKDYAFLEIYKIYENPVKTLIKRKGSFYSKNFEDISQNVFKKIFINRRYFNLEKGNISNWIYTIAHREAVSFYRKNKIKFGDLNESIKQIDFNLSSKESLDIKPYLDDIEYNLIVHKLFLNKSFSEVSEIFSIPENTAKTKFYRAILKLRRKYSD